MSREKPRRGPSAVDKDEGAVVPQRGQLFLLLDQEALEQERRIKPWTIEFGNVHADPELVRLDFDQHGLGSDLEKPRFRPPHRQFSSVNFMREKQYMPAHGRRHCCGHPRHFGGMTGNRTPACRVAPKCSVTLPPKISGGRSVGSSCTKGPQPRMGFFMLESDAASPWCS